MPQIQRKRRRSRSSRRRRSIQAQCSIEENRFDVVSMENEGFSSNLAVSFARVLARRAMSCICAILFISITAAALSIEFVDLSRPDGGLRIRDTLLAEQADAQLRAFPEIQRIQREALQQQPSTGGAPTESSLDVVPTLTSPAWYLEVVYLATGKNGNVLNEESLRVIRSLESQLQGHTNYSTHCLVDEATRSCAKPKSILNWIDKKQTRAESDAGINDALLEMRSIRNARDTEYFFDRNFTLENRRSMVTRSRFLFGKPLMGFSSPDDRADEQEAIFEEFIMSTQSILRSQKTEDVEILYEGSIITLNENLGVMADDFLLCVGSIAIVLFILFLRQRSWFLSIASLIQILLSFPISFFIYRGLLQIKLFGALNILSVFIVIGIGADDVFVVFDAVLQARGEARDDHDIDFEERLVKRVAKALSRAVKTISITSATSLLAFLSVSISLVPAIRFFGIFTLLMVLVNFILCITFFAAAQVLVLRHPALNRPLCCAIFSRFAHEEVVTSSDPEIAEEVSASRGSLFSFFLTYGGVIERYRFVVFLLCLVLAIVFSVISAGLRPAEETFSFWPPDHPLSRLEALRDDVFRESDDTERVTLQLSFGIDGVDRTGTDSTDFDDLGKTVFSEDFEPADPSVQLLLAALCATIRQNHSSLHICNDSESGIPHVACIYDELASWRASRAQPFPVSPKLLFYEELSNMLGRQVFQQRLSQTTGSVNGKIKFVYVLANITETTAAVAEERSAVRLAWSNFLNKFKSLVADDKQGVLASLQELIVQSSQIPPGLLGRMPGEPPLTASLLDDWVINQSWSPKLDTSSAMEELIDGVIVSNIWFFLWGETQTSFQTNAFLSLSLTAVAALVMIFVTTCSFVITFVSLITLASVVAIVIGILVVLDWPLGSLESVCITILVGLSVDYIIHNSFAISEESGTWNERVRIGMATIAPSLFSAAVSTLAAALFLFFTTITFFNKFGVFLFINILTTIVFVLTCLPASLLIWNDIVSKLRVPAKKTENASATRRQQSRRHFNFDRLIFSCTIVASVLILLGLVVGGVTLRTPDDALLEDEQRFAENTANVSLPTSDGYSRSRIGETDWFEISPPASSLAVCARGSPYSFFFRPGSSSHVIVEFEGGGACWSTLTCRSQSATFKDSAASTRFAFRAGQMSRGIRSPQSFLSSYSHLYVTYCTSDLHWGANEMTYDDEIIRHFGAINAASALEFLRDEIVDQPERILVTGCSAGAYGSLLHAFKIAEAFPEARIYSLGDSGVGAISDTFLRDSFKNWNAIESFPPQIFPELQSGTDVDQFLGNLTLSEMYLRGATMTRHRFAQWTTAFDWNQAFFYGVQNENATEERDTLVGVESRRRWHRKMTDLLEPLRHVPKLNFVVWPGDDHCSIPYARLQTVGATSLQYIENSSFKDLGPHPAEQWLKLYLNNEIDRNFECSSPLECELEVDMRRIEF